MQLINLLDKPPMHAMHKPIYYVNLERILHLIAYKI